MTEEDLTALEMLTLLCMSDRTHSQLMDLMPEKCGLTGHTKDFEPTLKEISDYRAPNFEVGGTMQQGMYIPKGSASLKYKYKYMYSKTSLSDHLHRSTTPLY